MTNIRTAEAIFASQIDAQWSDHSIVCFLAQTRKQRLAWIESLREVRRCSDVDTTQVLAHLERAAAFRCGDVQW